MKIAMDEKNVKSFAEVECPKTTFGMDFKNHFFFSLCLPLGRQASIQKVRGNLSQLTLRWGQAALFHSQRYFSCVHF
jgi:hypothetical protein